MTFCSYCGSEWKWEDRQRDCTHCGAPNKLSRLDKDRPFFYEGYIVYSLHDWCYQRSEFVFYAGTTFMGRVFMRDDEMRQYDPATDIMPHVMEKFRLCRQAIMES